MRFSPLHWFFVVYIEPEISLEYDSITLTMMLGFTSSLPLPSGHMYKLYNLVLQLAIFSHSELSVIGIICPATLLLQHRLWMISKMNLINFLWTTDWHWNLITVLPYFFDYRHCLSFNSVLLTGVPATWPAMWLWWLKLPMGQAMSRHLKHLMGVCLCYISLHIIVGIVGIRGPLASHKP